MIILVKTLIYLTNFIIFYQDIKHQAVYWFLFPILFLLIIFQSVVFQSVPTFFLAKMTINFLLLLIIFSVITLYYAIKGKKIKTIFSEMIGLGDLLFFAAVIPFFSPYGYCLFLILGSIISLFGKIIYEKLEKKEKTTIPLAGNLALMLNIIMIAKEFKVFSFITNNYEIWMN